MTISIGIVGAGSFSGAFVRLWRAHPSVAWMTVTDLRAERAQSHRERFALDGVADDLDAMLASDVDAVAIFTQRWTHGPLVVKALRAGKHVYSAVPMAITREEIADIIRAVEQTGLTYMMGETSYFNPATIFARQKIAAGEFGRVFYAEGDYLHDMEDFYDYFRVQVGGDWKAIASVPPMLYATHSVGGVLGAWPTYATSVSCIGIRDLLDDGVFDRAVSFFDNDVSNATALFETADGGAIRINEMRRIGYPTAIRESRFRFFGTEATFEQIARMSVWQNKHESDDVSALLRTSGALDPSDPAYAGMSPGQLAAMSSGHAAVHDTSRLPVEFAGLPNGHEGSHHLLAHEFVSAIEDSRLPGVNAWVAARFTLPGIVAHESARRGGERLAIDDFGDAPG